MLWILGGAPTLVGPDPSLQHSGLALVGDPVRLLGETLVRDLYSAATAPIALRVLSLVGLTHFRPNDPDRTIRGGAQLGPGSDILEILVRHCSGDTLRATLPFCLSRSMTR